MGIHSVENTTKVLSSNFVPWSEYNERNCIVASTSICRSWGDLLSNEQPNMKNLLLLAKSDRISDKQQQEQQQWVPYSKNKQFCCYGKQKNISYCCCCCSSDCSPSKSTGILNVEKQKLNNNNNNHHHNNNSKTCSTNCLLSEENWFENVKSSLLPAQLLPRTETCQQNKVIIDVWFDNLEEEFRKIRDIVEKFHYVAIDTEFPGVITRANPNTLDFRYKTTKYNVDLLNIIQLGITFANESGELPEHGCTWQFNFKFDLSRDLYAEESIQLLKEHGVNFYQHQTRGIDVESFGEMIMSSGLVMSENIKWISFHGVYDFGYLLKLLTCQPLPETEKQFFDLLHDFFPSLCDIKNLVKGCSILGHANSLTKLAKCLKVQRLGEQHQAGSDSLVTCQVFFKLINTYLKDVQEVLFFSGHLYGLNYQSKQYANQRLWDNRVSWDTKRLRSYKERLKFNNFEEAQWFE